MGLLASVAYMTSAKMHSLWKAVTVLCLLIIFLVMIMMVATRAQTLSLLNSPPHSQMEPLDLGSVDLRSVDLSGCGEWTKTCEEECVDGGGPIPNLVHFIKTDNDFHFYEWVAVLAARKAIKPKKIFVHSVGEIKSCWWNRILPFVEHHIVPSDMWVEELNGKNITQLAHKADFMKNALLYQIGGIYSDTDSIATKSFDDLLHNYQAVISRQDRKWPGNGLVLARKQSCFVCAYAKRACQNFNGDWNSHSIITLRNLVNEQTKTHRYKNVKILEYRIGFFPFGWNRDELDALYKKDMKTIPFSLLQVHAIHLFHHAARAYLPNLDSYTPGSQKVQVLQLVLFELHFLVGSMKRTTIKISA